MSKAITSFKEIPISNYAHEKCQDLVAKIKAEKKEYILNIDPDEYLNSLVEMYKIEPVSIDKSSENINHPARRKEQRVDRFYKEYYEVDVYDFLITYKFSGSPIIFSIYPSTRHIVSEKIYLSENTIGIKFTINNLNQEEFQNAKERTFKDAFINLDNANAEIPKYNSTISSVARDAFKDIKERYLKENSFFESIKVNTDSNINNIFTVDTIKKKIFPKPTLETKSDIFISEPTLNVKIYESILEDIYLTGKGMEQKPSLYIGKDEEGIRDIFLLSLESKYEGVSTTSETFNRAGKTDILLKHIKDNSNIFIAECKFWSGISGFHEAIDQLFGRYLTWRDSKVALLFFVKSKEFTKTIENIKRNIHTHRLFKEHRHDRKETSFSYLFKLNQDTDKYVLLEVLLFHFDKQK